MITEMKNHVKTIQDIDDVELINLYEKSREIDYLLFVLWTIGMFLSLKLLFWLSQIVFWVTIVIILLAYLYFPRNVSLEIYKKELIRRGLI